MGLDSGIERKRDSLLVEEELAYWRKCYGLDTFFRNGSIDEIISDSIFSIDIDLIETVREDAYNYIINYKNTLDKVCDKYKNLTVDDLIEKTYAGFYTLAEEEEVEQLMFPIEVKYNLIDYGDSIWNPARVAIKTYVQLTKIVNTHKDGDEYVFWSSY